MAFTNMSVTDTYDALLSTTLRNYRKKLEDNIFLKHPLLMWLNDKGRRKTQNGGYQIMIPLLYGENTTVQNYDKYDILDTTPQEGITTAKYDWKQLAISIAISRKEERQNSGEHQLINLLEAKLMQAEESAYWYLADMLHGRHGAGGETYCETGNSYDSIGGTNVTAGGNQFTSLDHFVRQAWGNAYTYGAADPTSQTVTCGGITTVMTSDGAGSAYHEMDDYTISASTNPWWLNYSIPGWNRLKRGGILGANTSDAVNDTVADFDGGTSQFQISAMRTLYNTLSDGGEHPDLGLCAQDLYENYEAALMPLERFTDTKLGDAGFLNLKFKGMTLMLDHGITTTVPLTPTATTAPAAPLYMLNSRYLNWVVDSGTDFITTPFFRPENQDAKVAQILLMANLVCSNRSKQGVLSFANTADVYEA